MSSAILQQVMHWRKAIAPLIHQHNPHLTLVQSHQTLQHLLLNLVCLEFLEQRTCYLLGQKSIVLSAPLKTMDFCPSALYLHVRKLANQVKAIYGLHLPDLMPDLAIADAFVQELIQAIRQWGQSGAIAPILLGSMHEQFIDCCGSLPETAPSCLRKSGGVYYTPPTLVEDTIRRAIGRYLELFPASRIALGEAPIRILDPACGGGTFLLAAYQFLLDWYQQRQTLTWTQRAWILETHLYGVDIDQEAVAVTRLALSLMLVDGISEPVTLPDLSHTIQWGNALIGKDFDEIECQRKFPQLAASLLLVQPLDWAIAFPQVLQVGGFDVVIGNPPYVDSERMTAVLPHWRWYCATHYQTAVGNWDLFCIFIEKGLALCKPGGLLSFVVPNKLTSAPYAAAVRSLLTEHHHLLSLQDYSQKELFSAAIYPLVFVVQKQFSTPGNCSRTISSNSTSQRDYPSVSPWLIVASHQQSHLVHRLRAEFPPLDHLAQVRGAATVAEAYTLKPLIQDCALLQAGDLQVINTGTLDPYRLLWGEKPMRYLGERYIHPMIPRSLTASLPPRRFQQATQPKLIVAGMTRGLECALDRQGSILAAKSTSIIQGTMDLRYLMVILNSRLMQFYVCQNFAGNCLQGGYLRIGPPQLKQLPIYVPDFSDRTQSHHYQQLLTLVDQLDQVYQAACPSQAHIETIDAEMNTILYGFYRLTESEIETINAGIPSKVCQKQTDRG